MLGERLQEIRRDHKETQQQLASYLHVSVGAVRTWERNISSPDHETLAKICRKYGVSADYLLGLIDDDQEAVSKINLLPPKLREELYRYMQYLFYVEKRDHLMTNKDKQKHPYKSTQLKQKNKKVPTAKETKER